VSAERKGRGGGEARGGRIKQKDVRWGVSESRISDLEREEGSDSQEGKRREKEAQRMGVHHH